MTFTWPTKWSVTPHCGFVSLSFFLSVCRHLKIIINVTESKKKQQNEFNVVTIIIKYQKESFIYLFFFLIEKFILTISIQLINLFFFFNILLFKINPNFNLFNFIKYNFLKNSQKSFLFPCHLKNTVYK